MLVLSEVSFCELTFCETSHGEMDFGELSHSSSSQQKRQDAKVIYMYTETGIKLKEGEVALVLLSAQAEVLSKVIEKKVLHMVVRDSRLCSADFFF